MRALLTPEIAPRMGIVLFRPGSELMPLFMQGRVLLEPEPERYSSFASGAVPAASQPLADDPAVRAVFRNEAVIRRAGGVECLEAGYFVKELSVASFRLAQREHDNNATRAGRNPSVLALR